MKIIKLLLTMIILLGLSENYYCQTKGTIRGYVTDKESGEALPYTNVALEGTSRGAVTDSRGYFVLASLKANNVYKVVVSFVGYQTKKVEVKVFPNKVTSINIELTPLGIEMEAVEKVADRVVKSNATDIGLVRITGKQLEALPQGVETDVFRSLQYISGVQSTGDVSAKYFVRGGSSDQNLVLLNGATIYNPFHALGMFSVIDPEIIKGVEFYKGGFTAESGNRISSVMKIVTKDGNKRKYSSIVNMSMLTGKLFVEGPISSKGSFVASGRIVHSNKILDKFTNDEHLPIDFYDFSAKVNFRNIAGLKNSNLTFFGFNSQDQLEYENLSQEDYKWNTSAFGIKWLHVGIDSPLFFELGVYYSGYSGEVVPNLSQANPQSNEVKDVSVNVDFSYVYESNDELGVGLEIKDVKTNLSVKSSLGNRSALEEKGSSITAYAKYKFLRYGNFGADIGARFNLIYLSGEGNNIFEPRVNLTYRIIPEIAVKASWGIYTQQMTSLTNEDEILSIFEPWTIIPSYLGEAKSVHYIAGIETQPFPNLSVSFEGYFKDVENAPTLNTRKDYYKDDDLIGATGEAYGWEATVNYKTAPVKINLSYSNSWAYKEVKGWTYYPRYDVRHSVNIGFEYNLGKEWLFTATWIYNSGMPFSKFSGYYNRLLVRDYLFDANLFDSIVRYSYLDDKNLGRLPDYHRLDVSLSKKFDLKYFFADVSFSVVNVYDRKNLFYFTRENGKRVNMLPILPTVSMRVQL
ncbi:MAG: carboxypeptidase-like regulatory domain-containing protein [Rhodothermaceae bacterium]